MTVKTRIEPSTGARRLYIDLRLRSRTTGQWERYRRDAQFQNKRAAEQEERNIIAHYLKHGNISALVKVAAKAEPAVPTITWEDATKLLIDTWARKPSTLHGYEGLLSGPSFTGWSKLPLTAIDRAHVVTWDAGLARDGMGDSTRAKQHTVMRSVLRRAVELGKLAAMPDLPPLPRQGTRSIPSALASDVARILAEPVSPFRYFAVRQEQFRLAVALSALAGLRAGEVRALRWGAVDLTQGMIIVRASRINGVEAAPKSGHDREIPIASELLALLKHHHQLHTPKGRVKPTADAFCCPRWDGKPWSDNALSKALQRACDRLDLAKETRRFHALRHLFVSSLFGKGVDARTVQELAGHNSLTVTQRYAHTTADRKRAAIALL